MIIRIQKSFYLKFIALFLATNLLVEIINPIRLFALTSGPTQPEMQGFSPVTSNDMVNLFTGDFNYSIPIMNIPGPGGEYPIVLNYNAGPSVEQEASWVGLGWTLNPGAINREMRGLPDDYNGQGVTQTINRKSSVNLSLGTDIADLELFGLPIDGSLSGALNYNTYAGIGISMNMGLSTQDKDYFGGGKMDLNLSWSNQGGFDISPSLSYSKALSQKQIINDKGSSVNAGVGFNYNSRQGLTSMNINSGYANRNINASLGGGAGYAFSSYIPRIENEMKGSSFRGSLKLGLSETVLFSDLDIFFSYSKQAIKNKVTLSRAYGTLYLEQSDTASLQDYNTEKEGIINKKSRNLPLPIMTQDLYNVSGTGLSSSFRLFRNDIGGYEPKAVNQKTSNVGVGADLGTSGISTHIGVNVSDNVVRSYSGGWLEGDESFENHDVLQFNGNDAVNQNKLLYEAAYFKCLDDQSATETYQLTHLSENNAVRPDVEVSGKDVVATGKIATSDLDNSTTLLNPTQYTRKKRAKAIQYRTVGEASQLDGASYPQDNNLIHDFTVTDENGTRNVYGEPLYNKTYKEVTYATDNDSILKKRIVCLSSEATMDNSAGTDHFYSSKELSPYAHTYLLTAILSPDYVDLDGNNVPSNNDLGYWVKFSYDKKYSLANSYKWRMPYKKANLSPGYLSNKNDNKASYIYGEKEVAYVNRIETKTHVAKFHMSPRQDGLGASDELGSSIGTQTLYQLDSISLYAKTDTINPIKTAHFVYTRELCQGTENSSSLGGKLTLKELYFTFGYNKKGKYSSYKFDYINSYKRSSSDSTQMNYGIQNYDRWGNFNDSANIYNPYVSQLSSNAGLIDQWASAWCLKKITLPSGSTIKIEYESDDYAYVQNKQAAQMFKIAKLGGVDGKMNECTKDNLRVYFKMNNSPTVLDVKRCIEGLKDNLLYFKTYMTLNTSNDRDYIEGYAEVNTDPSSYGTEGGLGYITLKDVDYGSGRKTHPFRMAAWQYLRMYRTDLLYPSSNANNAVIQIVYAVIDFVKELGTMLTGYYNYSYIAGRGKYIALDPSYPSFIRLNNPEQCKKGGGHRVKRIEVTDDWNKPTYSTYAQHYIYKTFENGRFISSGVAEYEPMVGGEENPLRTPVFYSTDRLLCRNDDLYVEEPFNESYFPSPTVGYSKVLVYNELPSNVTKAATGITLNEFYTAKDFPVVTGNTEIDNAKFTPFPIMIPFLGSIGFSTHGYTQGYSIELNNMHGQKKGVSTYQYESNPLIVLSPSYNVQPVSKEEYFYKTKYPYDPNNINRLNNTVDVLMNDNAPVKMTLGETFDFFALSEENRTNVIEGSGNINLDFLGFIPISAMVTPGFEINDEYYRTSVTNKVIYRNGILEEIVVTKDGAKVSNKNLLFDAYTGNPVMTQTTTSYNTNIARTYNAPVYTYDFMGKWYNKNMLPSYLNTRFSWAFPYPGLAESSSHYFIQQNASKYLVAGDEIYANGIVNNTLVTKRAWVTMASQDTFRVQDMAGNYFTNLRYIKVINSGYKNQQSTSTGFIKSLTNPIADRKMPLFDKYNSTINTNPYTFYSLESYYYKQLEFKDCFGKQAYACIIAYPSLITGYRVDIYCADYPRNCTKTVDCTTPCYFFKSNIITQGNLDSVKFKKNGNYIRVDVTQGGITQSELCELMSDIGGGACDCSTCMLECLDGVLDAKAIEFKDKGWIYPYADANNLSTNGILYFLNSINQNPYSNGKLGINRVSRENLYLTDRKQSQYDTTLHQKFKTNSGLDGTYSTFCIFDWKKGNEGNIQNNWKWTAAPTIYSPYGYEIENVNALNIYSSALYGYDNSLAVAVSNNARYFEIANEGFEDYNASSSIISHGHILTTLSYTISAATSHTGKYCLLRRTAGTITTDTTSVLATKLYTPSVIANKNEFTPFAGSEYIVSAWIKPLSPYETTRTNYYVRATCNPGSTQFTAYISANISPIDGWLPVKLKFKVPSTATSCYFDFYLAEAGSYIDDIRIQPASSSMKTYVYDSKTLKLLADLDENNYATYYNYDEEGTLVQVKKETEKGIFTIKTTRQNIKTIR